MWKLKKFISCNFGITVNNFTQKLKYTKQDRIFINNLLHEHKILLFKNAVLNYDQLENFAKLFGEPEITHPIEHQIKGHPYIRIQSNVLKEGLDYAGGYWHADGPWHEVPTKATLLLCTHAPSQGGETMFADMRSAYNDLPDGAKDYFSKLNGIYPCKTIYLREMHSLGLPPNKEKEAELKDLAHPLLRLHPITGKKSIYLNELWLKYVDRVSAEESKRILDYLYQFSTQDIYLYKHEWGVNDLLIWDNSSTMHKGIRPDPMYPKTTLRITIK